jgi:hypothetical protein
VPLGDPGGHAYPALHWPLQAADVVMPDTVLKVPPGHSEQLPTPPPLNVPGPHRTAVALVEPAGHAYPGEHAPLHAALVRPKAPPKVPPGHIGHAATPPVLYWPRAHTTAVVVVDPVGHAYPAAQYSR